MFELIGIIAYLAWPVIAAVPGILLVWVLVIAAGELLEGRER